MDSLTPLEKQRAAIIARNNAALASTGLDHSSLARDFPSLIRQGLRAPARRPKCAPAALPPLSIQLRRRQARPQYCEAGDASDSSGNNATSGDSYEPSVASGSMSEGGGVPLTPEEEVDDWINCLEQVRS